MSPSNEDIESCRWEGTCLSRLGGIRSQGRDHPPSGLRPTSLAILAGLRFLGGRGAARGGAWATWVQTQTPGTSQSQRQLLRLQPPESQPAAALQTGPPATHRLVTDAANTSATLCQKKTCSSIQIAASLASYYPFTQIFRLISLQMGRINGLQSWHWAPLIEMDAFAFQNGQLILCHCRESVPQPRGSALRAVTAEPAGDERSPLLTSTWNWRPLLVSRSSVCCMFLSPTGLGTV